MPGANPIIRPTSAGPAVRQGLRYRSAAGDFLDVFVPITAEMLHAHGDAHAGHETPRRPTARSAWFGWACPSSR